MVLDGLCSEEPDGTVRFDEATRLTGDDAHHLQPLLQRRILRAFQRRGRGSPARSVEIDLADLFRPWSFNATRGAGSTRLR